MSETNQELDDFFGDARQGGSEVNWKMHKITEEGPNIFRIAPSVKSLRASGQWRVFGAIHYGYTVPNDQNPDKPRHKPFVCIEKKNRATGMLEQDCPECKLIETKTRELDEQKAKHMAAGKTEEQAEEYVKAARKHLRENHSLDRKWYVLAKNLNGEWGVLKIPLKVMRTLVELDEKFKKDNVGTSIFNAKSGVWMNFSRTGKGFTTNYNVEIATERLEGGSFRYKVGELTVVDQKEITKCPDLANLNDNKRLTYDQIEALVRSAGDPAVVSQVFGQGVRQTQPAAPAPSAPTVAPAAPAPVLVASASAPSAPEVDEEEAELLRRLAAKRAAKQATPAPVMAPKAVAAPAPSSNFQDMLSLDAEKFLQMFPDPNKK